jgi:phosphatidylglycerophosphate synthase
MRLLDPANAMSLVRIPLALLLWVRPQDPAFLLTVMVAAAVSDMLDGALGRREHAALTGTKNIGAWLDPLCDKVFMASAAAVIFVTYAPPALVIALVLLRDVAIAVLVIVFRVAGGRAAFHAHDFRATATGKAATVAQVTTIAAVVLAPQAALACAVLTAGIGVVAVIDRVSLALQSRRATA